MELKVVNKNTFGFYKNKIVIEKLGSKELPITMYTDNAKNIENFAKDNGYIVKSNEVVVPSTEDKARLTEFNQALTTYTKDIASIVVDANDFLNYGIIVNQDPVFKNLAEKYKTNTIDFLKNILIENIKKRRYEAEQDGPVIKNEYFEADVNGKINTIGAVFGSLLKAEKIKETYSNDKVTMENKLNELMNTNIDWKVKSGKRIPVTLTELRDIAIIVLDYVVICHEAELRTLKAIENMPIQEIVKYKEIASYNRGGVSEVNTDSNMEAQVELPSISTLYDTVLKEILTAYL